MKALLLCLSACSLPSWQPSTTQALQSAENAPVLRILHTTDLHANVLAWDYFLGKADPKRGLAKVATLVRERRADNPCSLLVDAGDATAGSPLAAAGAMAAAMNAVGYDAMAIGNHEFDNAPEGLAAFVGEAQFPVLSANITGFAPYVLKDVCGVRVGILGLTTPAIPSWAKPEQIVGLQFEDPIQSAARLVPELRSQGATVVVVVMHAGSDKQPKTPADPAAWLTPYADWIDRGNLPSENQVVQLAEQVPGIDVIVSGHTHQAIPEMRVSGVVIAQANKWGSHLGEIDVTVGQGARSRLIAVDEKVAEDAAVVAAVSDAHAATLALVDRTIGHASGAFVGGAAARLTDSALADFINSVQLTLAAKSGLVVDASAAAVFSDAGLPAGDVKLRDAYGIYPYDNTLYVLEVSGAVLRAALERDAEYFAQFSDWPAELAQCIVGNDMNWDLYAGIDYAFDLAQPKGSRVTRLQLAGGDVAPEQIVHLALNNYRAVGGGGYDMFKQGRILWKSADGVRDAVVEAIASSALDPASVGACNFSLSPNVHAHYLGASRCP